MTLAEPIFSPEIESEFAALLRMLDFSEGSFSISVAVCNDLEIERSLVSRLQQLRPEIQELTVPPLTSDLLQFVLSNVTERPVEGLLIRNLQASVSSQSVDYQTFQTLNADRDRWPKHFAGPVVIWLPEYAAAKLATNALDFSRMISHRFHFVKSVDRSLVCIESRLKDVISTHDLAVEERLTRLSELKSRLKASQYNDELLHQRLSWLLEAADHLKQLGDLAESSAIDIEALQLAEQILQQSDQSSESLRITAISLDRIGDLRLEQGDSEAARVNYKRSLKLREQIVQQFGETQQNLRDLSVSMENLGYVEQVEGKLSAALDDYSQSLRLREQIVQRFGESPQSLRDVSVLFHLVGDVERARGNIAAALDSYRRGLQACEKVSERFGESPESLRDKSILLDRLGDVALIQGDRITAGDQYRASLLERGHIIKQFGEAGERLRDMAVSLIKVADVEWADGDRSAAIERYRRSLKLAERILEQFGATPQSLRDVCASLMRVGDMERAAGNRLAALERYRRSLELCEQIVEQFGASPQSLRDVSVLCERMGDVASESEPPDLALAEQYYRRSLANWGLMRERYEVLPDTLEGPTFPRMRLGILLLQAGDPSGEELLVAAATDLQTVIDYGWATPATRQKMEIVTGILQQLRRDDELQSP